MDKSIATRTLCHIGLLYKQTQYDISNAGKNSFDITIGTHIVNRPLQGAYAFIFSLARQWTMEATRLSLIHTGHLCQLSKCFPAYRLIVNLELG